MSVKLPTLLAGAPDPAPTINFSLHQLANGVAIEAKHSEDVASQTIVEIGYNDCGQLEVRTRDIFAANLCEVASIEPGHGLRARFVSNQTPAHSHRLERVDG